MYQLGPADKSDRAKVKVRSPKTLRGFPSSTVRADEANLEMSSARALLLETLDQPKHFPLLPQRGRAEYRHVDGDQAQNSLEMLAINLSPVTDAVERGGSFDGNNPIQASQRIVAQQWHEPVSVPPPSATVTVPTERHHDGKRD